MIFVTVGTHDQGFDRLIKRIDDISPGIKEEIVIQKGHTKFTPKNCKYFEFRPSLKPYFERARLIITHSAMSLVETIAEYEKPVICVPRQYQYGEHINDHQVEFAESVQEKTGVEIFLDIDKITPKLLENYRKVGKVNHENLRNLQNYLKEVLEYWEKNR